jgi:hypothetical protein
MNILANISRRSNEFRSLDSEISEKTLKLEGEYFIYSCERLHLQITEMVYRGSPHQNCCVYSSFFLVEMKIKINK